MTYLVFMYNNKSNTNWKIYKSIRNYNVGYSDPLYLCGKGNDYG